MQMKGVSKYGQFIVRSSSSTSLEDKCVTSNDAIISTTSKRAMQGCTKLLIKDGKLRAPLGSRSTNQTVRSPTSSAKPSSTEEPCPAQAPISNQQQQKHELTYTSTVSYFKENISIKDNFEVFQDEEAPQASNESIFSVCKDTSYSSSSSSTKTVFQENVSAEKSLYILPPAKLSHQEEIENDENVDSLRLCQRSPCNEIQPTEMNDSLSKKRKKCFENVTQDCVNTSEDRIVEDEEDDEAVEKASEYPSEYKTANTSFSNVEEFLKKERNILYTTSGYDMDVFKYQMHREQLNVGKPRANYINKQNELNGDMRAVLVDWFVDVCQEYDLSPATFFLAVSLVDRTLSTVDCPRAKLQLLGATAIFVAAKMEEVYPPQLTEIVFITEDTYTTLQVRRMEKVILRVIDFQLNVPLVDTFANFYTFFQPLSPKANCLMWYLLELAAMRYDCIKYKPSRVAAAAYCLAKHVTSRVKPIIITTEDSPSPTNNGWSEDLTEKTGIGSEELVELCNLLAKLFRNAENNTVKAIYSKYSIGSNHQVSCAIKMPENLSDLFAQNC